MDWASLFRQMQAAPGGEGPQPGIDRPPGDPGLPRTKDLDFSQIRRWRSVGGGAVEEPPVTQAGVGRWAFGPSEGAAKPAADAPVFAKGGGGAGVPVQIEGLPKLGDPGIPASAAKGAYTPQQSTPDLFRQMQQLVGPNTPETPSYAESGSTYRPDTRLFDPLDNTHNWQLLQQFGPGVMGPIARMQEARAEGSRYTDSYGGTQGNAGPNSALLSALMSNETAQQHHASQMGFNREQLAQAASEGAANRGSNEKIAAMKDPLIDQLISAGMAAGRPVTGEEITNAVKLRNASMRLLNPTPPTPSPVPQPTIPFVPGQSGPQPGLPPKPPEQEMKESADSLRTLISKRASPETIKAAKDLINGTAYSPGGFADLLGANAALYEDEAAFKDILQALKNKAGSTSRNPVSQKLYEEMALLAAKSNLPMDRSGPGGSPNIHRGTQDLGSGIKVARDPGTFYDTFLTPDPVGGGNRYWNSSAFSPIVKPMSQPALQQNAIKAKAMAKYYAALEAALLGGQ